MCTQRNAVCSVLALLACLSATVTCVSRSAPQGTRSPASGCELIGPGEPITAVALGQAVSPSNAPHPTNESEQFVFRQLYETLIRVDCEGRVAPALAASWQREAAENTWTFTLRPDLRFSDGTLLMAADIVSGWTTRAAGTGEEILRPEIRRIIRSIRAVDDRTLEIVLQSRSGDGPLGLAHTDLAISKRVAGELWPVGTRPVRVAPETAVRSNPSEVVLMGFPQEIRLRITPGRDARDLLDEGVDLLISRDPAALGYAASLPQFVSVPLQWQKTHVLLVPGRPRGTRSLSTDERDALARDAVRGEARGAIGPFWWESPQGCEAIQSQPRPASPPTGSVVYDGSDAVARELAERLVGLVRASGPGPATILDALLPDRTARTFQRATGLAGDALLRARRGGNDAGYILPLDSRPLDACREMQVMFERVGWVDPETIVPLVDTRLHAIVRRGRSGLTAEWDGGLLLGAGEPR